MSSPMYIIVYDPILSYFVWIATGQACWATFGLSDATTVDDKGNVYYAIGKSFQIVDSGNNYVHMRYSAIFYYPTNVNIVRLTLNVYATDWCPLQHPSYYDKFIDATINNLSLTAGYHMFVVDITISAGSVVVQ